ncbi:unnamed protein product, partial [Brachionus calyciflorus]
MKEGYAKIAASLHALQSPKVQWIWSDCCTVSFENLPVILKRYRLRNLLVMGLLMHPQLNLERFLHKPMIMETNMFMNRLLKGSERHYSITELECLA